MGSPTLRGFLTCTSSCPFDLGNRHRSYFTKSKVVLRKAKCPDQGDTAAGWLDQPLCQRALESWFCALLCIGDIVAGNTSAVAVSLCDGQASSHSEALVPCGRQNNAPSPQDAYVLTLRT